MEQSNKIRFAIIGCGRIGQRHIKMLHQHPQTDLVALIESKSREEIDLPLGITLFNSLQEFFSSGIKADVITIATPNGLHARQAIECIEKGHHVVVEKPLALRSEDAKKILDVAASNGRYVFPVMQNRFSRSSAWLKELVESGTLGNIFLVQVNCFWNRDVEYYAGHDWHGKKELDGGPLFTQFAHFVDMIYWLFGDIENIQGKLAKNILEGITEFEDTGLLQFDLVKGGMGSLNYTTAVWDHNFESSLTVIAQKGTIKISGQYMHKVEYCKVESLNCPASLGQVLNQEEIVALAYDQHYSLIHHVVRVLQTQEENGKEAEDGAKVVDIIERMNNQLKFSRRKSVV
jgi:predicted dehydrogenase